MAKARLTKNGLIIPNEWLDKLGDDVEVKQAKGVVIIESKQRVQARRRLAAMARLHASSMRFCRGESFR